MDQLVDILKASQDGDHTTEEGEEWRTIRVPGFRVSDNPQAWRWASSWGRLLSPYGVVFGELGARGGYVTTSVATHVPGAFGTNMPIGLHRIIAYTFLGPPPDDTYTVDHIDRNPRNNRASNLRWASPTQQAENRERIDVTVRLGDLELSGYTYIAEQLGVPLTVAKDKLRYAEQNTDIELGGHRVTVVNITKKRLSPPTEKVRAPKRSRVPMPDTAPHRALRMFIQGQTVEQVRAGWGPNPIQSETIRAYIYKAIGSTQDIDLAPIAERLGLGNPDMRQTIREVVDRAFQNAYDQIQQFCVEHNLPPGAPEDWEVAWKASKQLFDRMQK